MDHQCPDVCGIQVFDLLYLPFVYFHYVVLHFYHIKYSIFMHIL